MTIQEIASLPDVSEGLENRIKTAINNCNNLEELIDNIKSKQFTQTRIQRILLYSLLNISKKDMSISRRVNPYVRVLGFNKHGEKIISAIAKQNPKVHVVISVKKFLENTIDYRLSTLIAKDILATNIYTLGYDNEPLANLDYIQKVIEI